MAWSRKRRVALGATVIAAIGTPIGYQLAEAHDAGPPQRGSLGEQIRDYSQIAGFFLILGTIVTATLDVLCAAIWRRTLGRGGGR